MGPVQLIQMSVRTDGTRIYVGERFSISLQRTLRIPEDGQRYPLPPTFGPFRIHRVKDFAERLPEKWNDDTAFFIGMYQREAVWLGFGGEDFKPNAVKVAVGGLNAISGTSGDDGLNSQPQNYLVCPDQPWLDGINAGDGFVRQFVAAPLGSQKTMEGQITGREEIGGIQFVVYEPKPGIFPDEPAENSLSDAPYLEVMSGEMGLAAGGEITQKIYKDPYGIEVWEQNEYEDLAVYILNSTQYRAITGVDPQTPITVETYAENGLPWFELYDESKPDVPAPKNLAGLKTMTAGEPQDEPGVTASELPAKKLNIKPERL